MGGQAVRRRTTGKLTILARSSVPTGDPQLNPGQRVAALGSRLALFGLRRACSCLRRGFDVAPVGGAEQRRDASLMGGGELYGGRRAQK